MHWLRDIGHNYVITESHESINTKTSVIEIRTLRLSPGTTCVPILQVHTIFRKNEFIIINDQKQDTGIHDSLSKRDSAISNP